MIVLNVTFHVIPEKKAEFLEVMAPLIAGTRSEVGNLLYELHVSLDDAFKFVLVENFVDEAAVEVHNNSDHFKTYAPQLSDLCEHITAHKFVSCD